MCDNNSTKARKEETKIYCCVIHILHVKYVMSPEGKTVS